MGCAPYICKAACRYWYEVPNLGFPRVGQRECVRRSGKSETSTSAIAKYQELAKQLTDIRKMTGDMDCTEDGALLDAMDPVWSEMVDSE